ncbi:MAG: hypothetical protein K0Q79_2861 [Flavipsychrobacter sp.]|jgi:hypothetical protein|nr:hypothetical protein [Flavipsychrobacter sp.]
MKKIAYILLAATIGFAACKKQRSAAPATTNPSHITEADFRDCKTTMPGLHAKKSSDGLELDYDLVIKEVATNKYEAAVKVKGLLLNGKKVDNYKAEAIIGVVLAINTTKEEKTVPLTTVLESSEENVVTHDKTFNFPAFDYKGDLAYEVVEVKTSFKLKGGSIVIKDDSKFTFFGTDMEVKGGGLKVGDGNIIFTESIDPVFTTKPITNGTGITITSGNFVLTDNSTFFVLPNGHTITQAPEAAKITIEEEKDGTLGYVTVTITGDPARYITSISYQACTADGTTKDPKEEPVMQFEATHFNEQNGVQRFKSTQKWAALYHKSRAKFHYGCMQHWHGSTRVDVMPQGEIIYRAK